MLFILIGILLFIISFVIKASDPSNPFIRPARFGSIILILIGLLSSLIVQIGPGTVGVQSLFGNVKDNTLKSGLNIINPLVKVIDFDIKTQEYTMSLIKGEGLQKGDDAIRVLSKDGLEVTFDLTVLYSVKPEMAPQIYREIGLGYRDVIVRPVTRTRIRDISASYEAVSLYSSKKEEFQINIFEAIKKDFDKRGFILEELLIRNIALPESVKKAIESKINAEQDAQKMEFVLQKESQEAERKRVEAQGIADYQKIITSTLTDKQLQYEGIQAQKAIAVSENSKIIIMGSGKNPLILNAN